MRPGFFLFSFALACFALLNSVQAQTKLVQYVDPMIGTSGHGHTYPGASLPFGLVQLSPDTDIKDWDWCSGYHYSDNSIMGFSHTHLSGTGCADYGDILIMPATGTLKTDPGEKDKPGSGYRSRFSHNNEVASAGYYSVLLDDYNIKAELTASLRAGYHKYTFPKSTSSHIIIDLVHGIQDKTTDSEIRVIDNKTIEGYRRSTGWARDHCVYFRAEFSKPFQSYGLVDNGTVLNGKNSAKGSLIKGFFNYSTSEGEVIQIKIGISHVSLDGARKNLAGEIKGWDFNKVRKEAESAWEKQLELVRVQSPNKEAKRVFYTALYHSLLNPNTFSDSDGSYMGMDGKVHSAKNNMYTVFSLWDTFRALHPLLTIIDRQKDLDMVRSLVAKYDESGLLPVWELAANETGTMIGNHSIPVIVDAYFKGIRDFDVEKAYEAMKKSAMQDHLGLDSYKQMGFIPADLESESVSKTLEYSYDDWCIAKMAKALGKEDDYKYFMERAKYYTNVFDPSTHLMRAKKNGKWFEPFDPFSVSGNYTEANAWQYSFFVPQDVSGLISLMGGDDKFISKLDELFTTDSKLTGRQQSDITGQIGQYAHGNEPSHHMAYLYNYAGAPWKAQQRIHQILTTLYNDKPDGLCGNEDCGQMSAWYVLSSMGIYPVCPGDTKYSIGTPLFEKIAINAGSGRKFTIRANNLSDKNFYVQSAKLNGREYNYSYIDQSDIVKGGELVLEMGPRAGKWGTEKQYRPVSMIAASFVPVPVLNSGERVFADSTLVALTSIEDSAQIYYSLDGSDPASAKNVYSKPLEIKSTTVLKALCRSNGTDSKVVISRFNKIPEGRSIKLNTQYHSNYTGGGAAGLIDSIHGTSNFHTEAWQGYEGNDLDAIIDLGKLQKLSLISSSFLQNTGSWIFLPKEIEYFVSSDGINFTRVYETANVPEKTAEPQVIKNFDKTLDSTEARYVRVYAKNVGKCPDWHVAAGNKAWLFIDEITVR